MKRIFSIAESMISVAEGIFYIVVVGILFFALGRGLVWAGDVVTIKVIDDVTIASRTIETNATLCETDSGDLRVVTSAVHGLAVSDVVQFSAGTGSLCTGLSASTDYYVIEVDTTKKVNLSLTDGGSAISYTNTGSAFNSYFSGPAVVSSVIHLRDFKPDGYFSLHVILTGSGTGKFEYLCSNDPTSGGANFIEPSSASDIVTSHTVTSGPGSDGIDLYSFRPELCRYMKIKMSETGIANSITAAGWLAIE